MAKNFDTISKPAAYVPENIIRAVFDDVEQNSVALTLGRRLSVPSSNNVIPLPTSLPEAKWVDGYKPDPKETTGMEWQRDPLRIYELEEIIGIPDAYIEDANVPIWDEIRPYAAQAISRKLDQAVLFGEDKPENTLVSVLEHATKAGSVIQPPGPKDVVENALKVFEKVGEDGYGVTATATAPGFEWKIAGDRVNTLRFDPYEAVSGRLFGMPFQSNKNGGWDASKASMIGGAWDHLFVGVRRDVRMEFSNSGVIRDENGKVTMSAWQDDMTLLRVTFRAGWRVVAPRTAMNKNKKQYSPFAVLTPPKKTS